jgi:hypothetical protein
MVVVGGWARNPPTALSAISQRGKKAGALLVAVEMQKSVHRFVAGKCRLALAPWIRLVVSSVKERPSIT